MKHPDLQYPKDHHYGNCIYCRIYGTGRLEKKINGKESTNFGIELPLMLFFMIILIIGVIGAMPLWLGFFTSH